jgi:hypothetical protein
MKKWAFSLAFALLSSLLFAENNASLPAQSATTDKAQLTKHLEEQIKREEHYAKTQSFAQGDDYNLSEHEIDPKDLENIQVDPPMYDFDMDDVYD